MYSYLDDLVPISFVHFLSSQPFTYFQICKKGRGGEKKEIKLFVLYCMAMWQAFCILLQPTINLFNISNAACMPIGIIPIGIFIYETPITF